MDTAADVMSSPVSTVRGDATVAEAMARMRAEGLTSLLVEARGDDDPPGFLSQTDLVTKVVALGVDPGERLVRDVMSRPVITVPTDTSVQDCALLMRNAQIRRVLVDDGERIVGIVSASDILRATPT